MIVGSLNMWDVALYVPIVGIIVAGICTVAMMIHYDSQGETFRIPIPRLPIPWSIASRLRQRKMEIELAKAEEELFTAKHARLQRELVHSDLVDEQYKRALETGH